MGDEEIKDSSFERLDGKGRNPSMESSKPRRKEYQSRRQGYFRNSQARENPVRAQQYYAEGSSSASSHSREYHNNLELSSVTNTENFNDVNQNKSDSVHFSSKSSRGRYQYSSTKAANYRMHSKDNKSYKISDENKYSSDHSSANHDVPNASQRGKIIGGRYIRRHSNQPSVNNSRSHDAQLQTDSTSKKFFSKQYIPHNFGNRSSHYQDVVSENPRTSSHNHRDSREYFSQSTSQRPIYQSKNHDKKLNISYINTDDNYKSHNHYSGYHERSSNYKSYAKQKSASRSISYDEENATQRELLIQRLNKGDCECLVCFDPIRIKDSIWHCLGCYHVVHLRCIQKWARTPDAAVEDGSWRCPACQTRNSKVPYDYYCFCGKCKNPEVNYHLTPHSCGEICDRKRPECSHHCKELCHPGPCPSCVVVVQKLCPCGKTKQTVPCNQALEATCQEICDKLLNCNLHRCKSFCHDGECAACEEVVLQKCYCGKNEKEVLCALDTASCFVYSCGDICNKELNCGHHTCKSVCHSGSCQPCKLSVEVVKTCCCGKRSINDLIASGKTGKRTSCLDPIPVCDSVCGKILYCGPKDNPHCCNSQCHEGECPKCPLSTSLKCCCGAFTKEFPCAEITESFVYTCEKRCNRRKDCGRHKCLNKCCTNIEHKCELVCNRKLPCGLHQCQETCHVGNCPTCWNVSFDELRCYCGESVLYPPIACGTKPPECSKPCVRSRPCGHPIGHTCHSDETCPPCTFLITKWCYGNHKQCGPVPCFQDGTSCGMHCLKPLPCGKHKCKLTCHAGECLKDSKKCTQACTVIRPLCGHPCGNQCHEGPCPDMPCKAQVTLSCPCGHRSETTTCYDSAKSYRLMSSTILATKMQEIKEGQSVNLNDVLGKKSKNNKLQCNEECAVIERNKRLAVALQIQNPDISCSPGPPSYSEFLKEEAKKNPHFVTDVYDKITNLVQLAKQSKQKCRSHSFPPMNRDHRRVVHELAEFFGCETQSYDEEPKKNVVVTAYKNKCWLPFTHIMTVVQRDMGFRKGPTPVLVQPKNPPVANAAPTTTQKKKVDYFDYNE